MYSDKECVNQLTALLVAHDVRHAVVCPGSRNAPIAHNLNECVDIRCYPVTDERSAAFFALGVAQQLGTHHPVALCVTSGSAILDAAPAVAEAFYQHLPLVVIAADRPAAWIGQLDGQTMPQPDALGRFVACSAAVKESADDEERWHNERMINEALLASYAGPCDMPVLINVALREPLYSFGTPQLPAANAIRRVRAAGCETAAQSLAAMINNSLRPMFVIGQTRPQTLDMRRIAARYVVMGEQLSATTDNSLADDTFGTAVKEKSQAPDLVIYMGDNLVSKNARLFLRGSKGCRTVMICADGVPHDIFMNLTHVIEADAAELMLRTEPLLNTTESQRRFHSEWQTLVERTKSSIANMPSEYSEEGAVRQFEEMISGMPVPIAVHYANSTAVRLGNRYARHYIYCNRGINGIDGSLSAAAGFSAAAPGTLTACVIGDLSFFYDQNALWNTNLSGNLRILLLNNGGGAIFGRFEGLRQSAARRTVVMACHSATACGTAETNNVEYRRATDQASLREGLAWLLDADGDDRPRLLECMFENKESDKERYHGISVDKN